MSIQAGSIGTALSITVQDEGGVVQDELLASEVTLRLYSPRGEASDHDVEVSSPAGTFVYFTTSGDLDIAGVWKMQAIVDNADGYWPSGVQEFTVVANLPEPT